VTSRPKYLSHSAYSQFLRCGLQYKYERIDKVPAPPAWYFIGGRAVHLATERMDAAGTWPYAADQLKEFWEAAFDQELDLAFREWPEDSEWRHTGRGSVEHGHDYWYNRGLLAVEAWQDWRTSPARNLEVAGVEVEIDEELPSGIRIKGYIDRVFVDQEAGASWALRGAGGMQGVQAHVLDLKSGTKRPSGALQLGFYKVGLELKFPGIDVRSGAWWMAKDAKEFVVPIGQFTADKIDYLAQDYYKAVENDIFLPNPGAECMWCPFKKQCPYSE